jgi:hypothetical protein
MIGPNPYLCAVPHALSSRSRLSCRGFVWENFVAIITTRQYMYNRPYRRTTRHNHGKEALELHAKTKCVSYQCVVPQSLSKRQKAIEKSARATIQSQPLKTLSKRGVQWFATRFACTTTEIRARGANHCRGPTEDEGEGQRAHRGFPTIPR